MAMHWETAYNSYNIVGQQAADDAEKVATDVTVSVNGILHEATFQHCRWPSPNLLQHQLSPRKGSQRM